MFLACAAPAAGAVRRKMRKSDVEEAVIGHGKVEGPFTEIGGLDIERDDRYPVRVTVQFYKATSNGVVSEESMAEVAAQIERVYRQADYVGSLVVQGKRDAPRSTPARSSSRPAGGRTSGGGTLRKPARRGTRPWRC